MWGCSQNKIEDGGQIEHPIKIGELNACTFQSMHSIRRQVFEFLAFRLSSVFQFFDDSLKMFRKEMQLKASCVVLTFLQSANTCQNNSFLARRNGSLGPPRAKVAL